MTPGHPARVHSSVAIDRTPKVQLSLLLTDTFDLRLHTSSLSSLADLDLPRYKIVVQVTIGERKHQAIQVASRCLWDSKTDNYASASFQNVRISYIRRCRRICRSRILPQRLTRCEIPARSP